MQTPALPIPEHALAALTHDLPQHGLKAGDVGTVVLVHQDGRAYEIEFCTLIGETIDVVTVTAEQVRPVSERELPSARRLAG